MSSISVSALNANVFAAYIRSNQIMGWGEKAIEIRSVETGHLDGVFMHKRAQRLKFLCERNDKVESVSSLNKSLSDRRQENVLTNKHPDVLLRCSSPRFAPEAPARSTSWLWVEATCSAGRGPDPALFLLTLTNTGSQNSPLMSCQRRKTTTTSPLNEAGAVASWISRSPSPRLAKAGTPVTCFQTQIGN